MAGGAAGTFYGAAALAWYPDHLTVDARGRDVVEFMSAKQVSKAMLRPGLWFAVVGATFTAVDCLAESARNTRDSWNATMGGVAAGLVMGMTTKRIDYMTCTAMGMGLLMGILDYSGPYPVALPLEVKEKMYGVLPETHVESKELAALKEKYPKFKNN